MNERKRKIEKELTKYDVDKDTQAKSQRVQHLSQASQYLPLFTKKVRDPKAMKNHKTTKDLDYTKNQEQLLLMQQEHQAQAAKALAQQAQLTITPRGGEQAPIKVIRDPSPRIVKRQEDDEEQQPQPGGFKKFGVAKRALPLIEESEQSNLHESQSQHQASMQGLIDNFNNKINDDESYQFIHKIPSAQINNQNGILTGVVKFNDSKQSPGKLTYNEIMNQLSAVERETYLLRLQVEEKKQDLELLNFKHAKAYSKFIEIMRELSRFRDEFNDQYSMRSKMIKVQKVTESIEDLLNIKEYIIENFSSYINYLTKEEVTLTQFSQQQESSILDDSYAYKASSSTIGKQSFQDQAITNIGKQLGQMCILNKNAGIRTIKISNVLCFANFVMNKQKAECTFTLQTKVSHETLTYTFTKITEKFQPWKEIRRLKLASLENGDIIIQCAENIKDKRVEQPGFFLNKDDSILNLYNGVENQFLKYVHGAPQRLFTLSLQVLPQAANTKRQVQFTVNDEQYSKKLITIEVFEERLFKDIVPSTLLNRNYEVEIRSLLFKRDAIEGLISKYVRKYLQVVPLGIDIAETNIFQGNQSVNSVYEATYKTIEKFGNFGIVDRELKNLKSRHTDFPGLRVPNNSLFLNNNANATISGAAKKQPTFSKKKHNQSSTGSTNRLQIAQSNEKMRNAVQDHLGKKKDFSSIRIMTQQSPQSQPMNEALERFRKSPQLSQGVIGQRKQQQAEGENSNKMQQIMKLIQANSMYMHVHSEMYIHDKDDFPAYLEMVHNTDDDSLILFIVDDPRDCFVKELSINELKDDRFWIMIQQRYGNNVEQVLCNVETIFRSNEFFNIIRVLIKQSRIDRQYQSSTMGYTMGAEDGILKSASGVFNFRIQVNQ